MIGMPVPCADAEFPLMTDTAMPARIPRRSSVIFPSCWRLPTSSIVLRRWIAQCSQRARVRWHFARAWFQPVDAQDVGRDLDIGAGWQATWRVRRHGGMNVVDQGAGRLPKPFGREAACMMSVRVARFRFQDFVKVGESFLGAAGLSQEVSSYKPCFQIVWPKLDHATVVGQCVLCSAQYRQGKSAVEQKRHGIGPDRQRAIQQSYS